MKPIYDRDGITLYGGDALDVLPHLPPVDAIITDPPYSSGGQFRGDRAQSTKTKYVQTDTVAYRPEFAGDNRDQRSHLAWSALWLRQAAKLARPGALFGCFSDWRQLGVTCDAIQVGGFILRGIAPWTKGYGRPTPGRFANAAEYLVWGSRGPMPQRQIYAAGRIEEPPTRDRLHTAQKPDAVMDWAISPVPPGSTILDPFAGAGSTLVAAKRAGQKAIGIELDPLYWDIIVARLDAATSAPESTATQGRTCDNSKPATNKRTPSKSPSAPLAASAP